MAVDVTARWHSASGIVAGPAAQRQSITSPLDGRPFGDYPLSTPADVKQAVRAATQAQRGWSQRPVRDRCAVIGRFHDLLADNDERLLDLLQLETGKTRLNAFEEVGAVLNAARHYARVAPGLLATRHGRGIAPLLTSVETRAEPWGVVGVVTPWNYPLALSLGDSIPALLAGNAVVLRPDPQTTLSVLAAVELLERAGLPDGVLQVVSGGADIGGTVVRLADYVAYTGSTATGRQVARVAAGRLVGASLELGGKNSLYVRADADLDLAAGGAVRSCFNSAGQLCLHSERLLLADSIADAFLARFLPRVRALRLGVGLNYDADVGSLAGQRQLDRVTEHLDDALAKGATVLAGGKPRPEIGPFVFEPTVIEGVTAAMSCRDAETFGPLVAVYRVESDDAAVRLANDTDYGLHATIYSRDTGSARQVAAAIRAGTVSINETYQTSWGAIGAPLGGMKRSGLGRRHGAEGLLRFTQAQAITVHRGVGFGVPSQLTTEQFAVTLRQALVLLKRLGLK